MIWQLLGRQKRWLVGLMVLALLAFTVAVLTAVTVQDAVDFALVAKVEPSTATPGRCSASPSSASCSASRSGR